MNHQKSSFFTDIWYPFCWRLLRPAYITFLKNGYKCQNVITSGICRTHYIYEIIYLDTCQSQITLFISMWDTLYHSVKKPFYLIPFYGSICRRTNHKTADQSKCQSYDLIVVPAYIRSTSASVLWKELKLRWSTSF